MGIPDYLMMVADDQDFGAGSIQSAAFEHVLNSGEVTKAFGEGRPLWFEVTVKEAFASAQANNTVQIQVRECDTEVGTYVSILSGAVIAKDALVAGAKIRIPYPYQGPTLTPPKQFIQLYLLQGGTAANWSAGIVDARLTPW